MEQELPTLPEHLTSSPVLSGVRVIRSLFLCVCFFRSLFVLLAIVLYVLLRYTDSDYPFGIFKLFLLKILDTAQTGVLSKHIYLSIS